MASERGSVTLWQPVVKGQNSGSETPFLTVETTGETPVPQFCHGLVVLTGR
ncbi:MAG: hypothetical protein JXQ75_23570 [Phycisphaerae bacterium]|nr:hypothetical protein [Phycisphaerae bacterium]